MIIKRGDIFLADLSPIVGSEQGGTRPVMVIQNNIGNRFSPTVIVAAITAQINRAKLPTHVELNAEKFNLQKDSVVLLEQIRTIDKMRLKEKISSASEDEHVMDLVTVAYQIAGGNIPIDSSTIKFVVKEYLYKINEELSIYEDSEYEFKEIKGNSPKNSINSNVSIYATAFLNSNGGRILFGISNERIVKGFQANANQIDEIKLNIYSSLRSIEPPLSGDHYSLNFHLVHNENNEPIKDLYILEIVVPPSPDRKAIYFDKGKDLYIRVDGAKQHLKGTEIVSHIQKKI